MEVTSYIKVCTDVPQEEVHVFNFQYIVYIFHFNIPMDEDY